MPIVLVQVPGYPDNLSGLDRLQLRVLWVSWTQGFREWPGPAGSCGACEWDSCSIAPPVWVPHTCSLLIGERSGPQRLYIRMALFFFLIRITKYSNSRCSYWPLVKSNFQNITDSRNVFDVKWFCISIIYTPLLLKRFEISNLVMKGVEYLSSLRDDPLLNRVLRPSHHYCSQNNPFIPRFEARVPCEW